VKIIAIRPAPPGSATLAHVDIEPSPGTRIYGVRISRADNGSYRAFGPSNDRGRVCAFDHDVANKIAILTVGALSQNETRKSS
jgi:hypothetical protein